MYVTTLGDMNRSQPTRLIERFAKAGHTTGQCATSRADIGRSSPREQSRLFADVSLFVGQDHPRNTEVRQLKTRTPEDLSSAPNGASRTL
jgi:hypothetical protein